MLDIRKLKPIYTISEKVLNQYCESTISISPDQRYLAVGSVKGSVYIFNVRDGSLAYQFDNKTSSTILCLQWRPNCSQLYVGDSSGNLSIWEK